MDSQNEVTNSLWTGLQGHFLNDAAESRDSSLAESLSRGLLREFPSLFGVTTPERLHLKLEALIRQHRAELLNTPSFRASDLPAPDNEDVSTSLNQLLFTAKEPSFTRAISKRGLPPRSPPVDRALSSSASRFLCDLAHGLPLSRPMPTRSHLWALQEDGSLGSSMSFTSPASGASNPKVASNQRRTRFTSIPTTAGGSSFDFGAPAVVESDAPFRDMSSGMSALWRPDPNASPVMESPWLNDLEPGEIYEGLFKTDPNAQAGDVPEDDEDEPLTSTKYLLETRPPPPPSRRSVRPGPKRSPPSTQVFCHMLAALRERTHHHHPSNFSCPASVSPPPRDNSLLRGSQRSVRNALGSSPLLAAPAGTRSPSSGSDGRGFEDDRERMVFVSWIPKRTRSYNAHEKRRLELELKAKLKQTLNISGVSKVLLFPPKGAHCKIIFQSRGCAAEFMKRYGGDLGSAATERWKRDVCAAFDIEMTERFQPTVVKVEWAQK